MNKRQSEFGRVCGPVILLTFICACLVCGLASAQSKPATAGKQGEPAQSDVKFTSRSELVLVPVIVNDHHGSHLAGLTKEDFSVTEDGAPRTISVFEEITANTERVSKSHPQTGTYTNVYTNTRGADNSAKRLVILALDTINTPFGDQAYARKQMIKFLSESVDPGALISLVTLTPGGVKVIHDFTTDTSLLIAALGKVTGRSSYVEGIQEGPAIDEMALQSEVDQLSAFADSPPAAVAGQKQLAMRWTYDALEQIAQAYVGVPGRKALVWVTAGFPFSAASLNNQLSSPAGDGDVSDDLFAYEHMWRSLTNANFAVYPVDARGLVNPASYSAALPTRSVMMPGKTPGTFERQQNAKLIATQNMMADVADMTGGRAFYNTNDLSKSFRQASTDSAAYYVLGYYLNKDAQPGWHKLKVKVNRAGTQVRARSGFLVAKPGKNDEEKARKTDIANALVSPFDFTGLPFEVRWAVRSTAANDPNTKVWFDLELAPTAITWAEGDNNHLSYEVLAFAKRADGTIAGNTGQTVDAHLTPENAAKLLKSGMTYTNNLKLPKGKYSVRFVVRDNLSGRLGSVSAPLTVE